MTALRLPLRVVFYQEAGEWVAHCLELDLIGCAETQHDALKLLSEAIVTQLEATRQNQNWTNLISPASGEYFAKFAAGHDVAEGVITLPADYPEFVIQGPEVREYREEWDARQPSPNNLVTA